jgi:regulator of protease activity HflC (stomatin/prohibitin superfamily)
VFLVLAAVIALGAIKIVPQGREYTVERFGRYTRSLKPGMSFLTPFVEGIGRKINMMEQVLGRAAPGRDHQGQRLRPGGRHRLHPGDGRRRRGLSGRPTSTSPSAS